VIWINPYLCRPPHRLTHPDKFEELVEVFEQNGWGDGYPALIGYKYESYIQLVSGTHRWFAAATVDMDIPVVLYTAEHMNEIWGTDRWVEMIRNPMLVTGDMMAG
jgi:hypothetical protein